MKSSITVGTVVDAGASLPTVFVDGQEIRMPNLTGAPLTNGQSVTVERLGQGRYQLDSQSGYWGPPPPP